MVCHICDEVDIRSWHVLLICTALCSRQLLMLTTCLLCLSLMLLLRVSLNSLLVRVTLLNARLGRGVVGRRGLLQWTGRRFILNGDASDSGRLISAAPTLLWTCRSSADAAIDSALHVTSKLVKSAHKPIGHES